MPEIMYARHAKERMRQRRITEADVDWALRHPIGHPEPGLPGSVWIRGYAVGTRVLKVCVSADDNDYVITAVWP
jgi:hypothetical protein